MCLFIHNTFAPSNSNKVFMKRPLLFILISLIFSSLAAQHKDSTNIFSNTAEQLTSSDKKLTIGGYGEVHFNQPMNKGVKENGTLDLHRLVLFVGYNFTEKTQFISEIEFEYAKELWVEQAYLQHRLNKYINIKAGLILVPMGIINEYHEPVTFHGVERPIIDNKVAPSTWREIGAGISGTIEKASLKYQLYVMGGLNGFDTKGTFTGSGGLREGRQKGSKAYVSSPAFAARVEYFGLRNLNLGLSGYIGKSQSKLYNKLNTDLENDVRKADSSAVGIVMIGADARYSRRGLELRGQLYHTFLSNTAEYNKFTKTGTKNNDLGKEISGFYAEAGYDVLSLTQIEDYGLVPFFRYEFYNMHSATDAITIANPAYKNTILTAGLTFRLNKNAAFKTDMQYIKTAANQTWMKTLNMGIAVMF